MHCTRQHPERESADSDARSRPAFPSQLPSIMHPFEILERSEGNELAFKRPPSPRSGRLRLAWMTAPGTTVPTPPLSTCTPAPGLVHETDASPDHTNRSSCLPTRAPA